MDYNLQITFETYLDDDNKYPMIGTNVIQINEDNNIQIKSIRTKNISQVSTRCLKDTVFFEQSKCFEDISKQYLDALFDGKCRLIKWKAWTDW